MQWLRGRSLVNGEEGNEIRDHSMGPLFFRMSRQVWIVVLAARNRMQSLAESSHWPEATSFHGRVLHPNTMDPRRARHGVFPCRLAGVYSFIDAPASPMT